MGSVRGEKSSIVCNDLRLLKLLPQAHVLTTLCLDSLQRFLALTFITVANIDLSHFPHAIQLGWIDTKGFTSKYVLTGFSDA